MFQSSVTPEGTFLVGKHSPGYSVKNLREKDYLCRLGKDNSGQYLDNSMNFPQGDVEVVRARAIYEIRNPLPFRGCTFIDTGWADNRVGKLEAFCIEKRGAVSLRNLLGEYCEPGAVERIVGQLPMPLRYELAATSTDAQELVWLAHSCCRFISDETGKPQGLRYLRNGERLRADIDDFELFETIANNPHLPDLYKELMVLRPGVQGNSEIVGEFDQGSTQIFEYLRTNSYIPWGHYAANFAHTAIRYAIADLSETDMHGLRHLYYQRMFVALASKLGLVVPEQRKTLSADAIETLRIAIQQNLEQQGDKAEQLATLWGWNFGYDFSGSGYRLHASHQMIHQQYAMVPQWVESTQGDWHAAYCCGDLVADVMEQYRAVHQSDFFNDYLKSIRSNTRTDQQPGEDSLVVWQDARVLLFVPKAQVSQWELQLMVIADENDSPVGNVFEANSAVRHSLDSGILKAQQVLAGLGAEMVSSIEYSKRVGVQNGQRLLYSFLPKLPWSMGAFSEAQGRYILGHYPEDFASACRRQLV
nr:hypothetical protein [uncultured Desulfobulbus sp.]